MTTTAAQMVGEANAQIEHVSPKDASDEVASGKAVLLDAEGAGGVGATHRRLCTGAQRPARVHRRPRQPQTQSRSSTRPAG